MRPRTRHHLILASAYTATLAALPVVARRHRERLGSDTPFDWARLALATYAASRIVAREKVGDFIREPLQEAARQHEQRVIDERLTSRAAAGPLPLEVEDSWSAALHELVTCTRCLGIWNATTLIILRAASPSHGRMVVDILSVAGANNFLQGTFTRLTAKANMDQHRQEQLELERERARAQQSA